MRGLRRVHAGCTWSGHPAPVQPQDLELMPRLHEMPQASGLILQFGPHKGDTLTQVAMHDPTTSVSWSCMPNDQRCAPPGAGL